jgi:Tc toxin complex TcA C-terminal TcB-binding domain/Neuraminidase-like domain/Salmonella virulence plasmid 28.1kDa A protein
VDQFSVLDLILAGDPAFDIHTADLLRRRDDDAQALRRLQRVLRIEPDRGRASVLLDAGLTSAHRITAGPRSRFVDEFGPRFGADGAAYAERIYDRARVVKARASHLVASVHSTMASRAHRGLAGRNVAPEVETYFQDLPSYQAMFGSLDYCSVADGDSILSPAAYLADLLRIIDLAITVPNTTRSDPSKNIPPRLTLDARRPDLGEIELDAENTYTEVPYLEIVCRVLTRTVAEALAIAPSTLFQTLAGTYYPFNLPYNRAVDRLRTFFAQGGRHLYEVYAVFPTASQDLAVAAEFLGLTREQLENLNPPARGQLDAAVSANYGLTISDGNLQGMDVLSKFLGQTGLALNAASSLFLEDLDAREIFDTSGIYATTGRAGTLVLRQKGDRVSGTFDGGVTVEGVLSGLLVSGFWCQASPAGEGTFELAFAADGASFQGQWRNGYVGPWDNAPWNGTRPASSVTAGIIPHSFYINKVVPARKYLHAIDVPDPGGGSVTMIDQQCVASLDTINRFVRAAAVLGWTYPELNWALISLHAPSVDGDGNLTCVTELDDDTIVELAKMKQLADDYELPLDLATSLWFDLRTIGAGAPFDAMFNDTPAAGRAPYRPVVPQGPTSYVNPLYTDTPLSYTLGSTSVSAGTTDQAHAIISSLPGSADAIAAIATAAFGEGATIDLTVPNLSVLARHLSLARALDLQPVEYVALLGLGELTAKNGLLPPTLDRDHALALFELAAWIDEAGFSIADLTYLVTGVASPYASTGYQIATVPTFLAALEKTMEPTLAGPAAFVSPGITAAESAAYYQVLVNAGRIDPVGLVVGTGQPDLSSANLYDPTVAAASPAQTEFAASWLTQRAAGQLAQAAGQVATYFGSPPPATTQAILAGAAGWLGKTTATELFELAPVFTARAASLEVGGLLSLPLVIKAFAAHQITLSPQTALVPLTATSWSIDGSGATYAAVSPDLDTIAYYKGATLLFRGALADVMASGVIDPAKVVAVFASHGITLPEAPPITQVAAPLAWTISDPKGATYFATQDRGTSAHVHFTTAQGPAPSTGALDLIRFTAQLLIVTQHVSLSPAALATVLKYPAPFGLDGKALGLAGIQGVVEFASLVSRFQDNTDALAGYIAGVASGSISTPAAADAALAAITSWDPAQLTFARTALFGALEIAATVARIQSIEAIFALAAPLGTDVYLLSDVAGTALATLSTGYAQGDALADRILDAIRARTSPEAWPTSYQSLVAPLLEDQRNALVPLAVWQLQKKYTDLDDERALYEFLLLEIGIQGCAQISVVKEALNAAQLYLQRCRLNLERDVTISSSDLPEVWWEWIMSYRVWQANREVFLYPENYLDPSLRRDKTALFQTLENDLLQGEVTPARVEAEFRKYLDGLAELASLEIVDACHATVHDEERGDVDTLFVFARTTTQPYSFYCNARERVGSCDGGSGEVWGEWRKIGLTINAASITSVYAFDRLLLFWSELETTQELDGSGDVNARATVTSSSTFYTFRNASGEWVQPQTLIDARTTNVFEPNVHFTNPFAKVFAATPATLWPKVGCLHLPLAAFAPTPGATERLVVFSAPLIDGESRDGSNPPLAPSTYLMSPDVPSFVSAMVEGSQVSTQLAGVGIPGKTPLFAATFLDDTLASSELLSQNEYLVFRGDRPLADLAPSITAGLNGSTLVVSIGSNSIVEGYTEGTGVSIPLISAPNGAGITSGSFQNDYVSAKQSAAFYEALRSGSSPLVDPTTGLVSEAITHTSLASLATLLDTDPGIARQLRETLYASLFGSISLFSKLAGRNARIMAVNNQPGLLILRNNTEDFLVEALSSGALARYPMLDQALAVATASPGVTAVTQATLVTRGIDATMAAGFYTILRTAPTDVIDVNGVVDTSRVHRTPVQMLALALQTDLGRAQQVRNILLAGTSPASVAYGGEGFTDDDSLYSLQFRVSRLTTSVIGNLIHTLDAGGIWGLLSLSQQQLPVDVALPFSDLGPAVGSVALAGGTPLLVPPPAYFGDQVDFDGPFGLYFWELFFHAPFLVAKMLHDDQRFADAQRWLQVIFDPTLPPAPLTRDRFIRLRPDDISSSQADTFYTILTTPPNQLIGADGDVLPAALNVSPQMLAALLSVPFDQALEVRNLLVNEYLAFPTARFWQFRPLRNHTLDSLRHDLTSCAQIATYNDDPFDPDAIARLRIDAYEKAIVIAYVQNLIDWGDADFTLYTWESITSARMLYAYALDLLGPRPADLGPCTPSTPPTFDIILARYGGNPDDIPQFLIDMENALPGPPPSGAVLATAGKPFNDLGGVFAIPENSDLMTLWDTLDDRLNKIRSCLNINGQPQPLPLFEPPIDPRALVRAAASGNNVLALQSQLAVRVPDYRFAVLLERARGVTATARSFGAQLLSALERGDAEALSLLQSSQNLSVLNLMTSVKQSAIDDLVAQIAGLNDALDSATFRQSFYDDLLAEPYNAAEIAGLTLLSASIATNIASIPLVALSVPAYLVPTIFGLADGGMQPGAALQAAGTATGIGSATLAQGAQLSQVVGEYQRRSQDWSLQEKLAGYEIAGLNEQIAAARARLDGARRELVVHLRTIANAQVEQEFLRTKFTNRELYQWLAGTLSATYFQAYRTAQALALSAQTALQFELESDAQIVAFDYWNGRRQGLLAGEGLALALDQLDRLYVDGNPRRLEIEKTISMRQAFPAAFIGFKWGYTSGDANARVGQLDFVLSESLFDFDYPGHYARKIKSVSVSLPALVGPYQDLHATLVQRSNAVAIKPSLDAVEYLVDRFSAGQTPAAPPAGTVAENWAPCQQIAVSRGVDDDGLFALDFNDPRYLPFENTGAVSSWTFSLPPETNQIDFDTISDVILTVRYTAIDGGAAFAQQVKRLHNQRAKTNPRLLTASFDLRRSFAAMWRQTMTGPPVDDKQTFTFPVGAGVVLPNLRNVKLAGVIVELQVAGQAVSQSAKPFLSVSADGCSETVPIQNNYGSPKPTTLSGKFAGVPWSLVFDLKQTPAPLLQKGALDPAALLDVFVAIAYTADPF